MLDSKNEFVSYFFLFCVYVTYYTYLCYVFLFTYLHLFIFSYFHLTSIALTL